MESHKNLKGDKQITLQDVATAGGVSRASVSHVLLGSGGKSIRVGQETSERIRELAQQMGYRPNRTAQQLAGTRSFVIGAIIDSRSPAVYFDRLAEMEHHASERGYRLIVGQSRGELKQLEEYASDFSSRGVDGVICMTHRYPGIAEQIAEIYSRLPNVVFIGRAAIERNDLNCVTVDTAKGVSHAVAHLVEGGRKRIGLLLYTSDAPPILARADGYRAELLRLGFEVDEDLIASVGSSADFEPEFLNDFVASMVRDRKVDALIGTDDRMAVLAIKQLHRLGCSVPEDVAIVGHDNTELSRLYEPAITSIEQKNEVVAREAINLLMKLIERGELTAAERNIVVCPKLIVRDSSRS